MREFQGTLACLTQWFYIYIAMGCLDLGTTESRGSIYPLTLNHCKIGATGRDVSCMHVCLSLCVKRYIPNSDPHNNKNKNKNKNNKANRSFATSLKLSLAMLYKSCMYVCML